jgi:ribosomal protein S18 acetylase RimI-like enzyme
VEIRRVGPSQVAEVIAAAPLFDAPPRAEWAAQFLARDGHHLLFAYEGDMPVGFVSGVETLHPDKGGEMLLYELAVDARVRRRGIGTALVTALGAIARERGCYGMWVPTEPGNEAAAATYRSAGGAPPEAAEITVWTYTDES